MDAAYERMAQSGDSRQERDDRQAQDRPAGAGPPPAQSTIQNPKDSQTFYAEANESQAREENRAAGVRAAAAAQAKSQPVAHLWPSWFLGDAHQWAKWQKSGLTRGRYPAWRAKYLNRRMSDLRQEAMKPRVEEDNSEQPDAKRHRRGDVDGDDGGEESRRQPLGIQRQKGREASIQSPPSASASIVELDS